MGFFQDGAPDNMPTVVSRLVQPIYTEVSQNNISLKIVDRDKLFLAPVYIPVSGGFSGGERPQCQCN